MNEIIVYTDGASRHNPGPGGWGAICAFPDTVVELGDNESKTTNNRMELSALLGAFTYILKQSKNEKPQISVFTDSSYAINGATKWVAGWKKNGWMTSQKTDVVNRDIWEKLDTVLSEVEVTWNHVKGHAGIPGNERCDEIATSFADEVSIDLYNGSRENYKINVEKPEPAKIDTPSIKDRSRKKAYSYLSIIDGQLQKHTTWADCENRVKGVKGNVKFRKSISKEDEEEIIKDWGVDVIQ